MPDMVGIKKISAFESKLSTLHKFTVWPDWLRRSGVWGELMKTKRGIAFLFFTLYPLLKASFQRCINLRSAPDWLRRSGVWGELMKTKRGIAFLFFTLYPLLKASFQRCIN